MKAKYHLPKASDLEIAVQELRGFWKLWSGCLLTFCGLPTFAGILITRSDPTVQEALRNFTREYPSKAALIRHDRKPESLPHPRGGFLVGQKMIDEVIRFFLDDGRIVGVYEPADPLLNGYNMNLLFESERELWIEVVGPGFDVSDLQRGDLSPHETFSARLSPKGEMSEVKLVQRVDQKAYEESVSLRKNKIRKKLESSPSPELACRVREELAIPEDIETHLKEIGSPLSESQNYRPVSCDVLRDTVNMILDSDVIRRYSDATGVKFPLNFSTSFVHRGSRQVFWDIVSPKLKFGALTKHPEVVS